MKNTAQQIPPTSKAGETTSPATPFSFEELEKIFLYFSTSMLEKNTEEEVLWDLANNCISQLRFVDCVIYLLDEKRQVLMQKAAVGPKNPGGQSIMQPIEIRVGEGITGSVAQCGEPVIVGDTSQDPRYIVDDAPRLSEIAVPIRYEGRVLGVIDCEHPDAHFFTQQHLRMLTAVASICAVQLGRVRAEERARQEQQALMEARQQMEELKVQALRAQINPHFLFNALNAIQYFLTQNEKKQALSYLSLFSKLIRYRLKHFRDDSVLLHQELEVMRWYFKLQQLRYAGRLSSEVNILEPMPPAGTRIPAMVLPFILENAVETSLSDQPAGHIQLTVALENGELFLSLEHNLRPEKKHMESSPRSLHGMESWQSQIRKLNSLTNYCIREETIFTNENSPGLKAQIRLAIPILEWE